MSRVIMVCNTFAPYNSVSSIRITKIAKYLSISGNEVTVICANKDYENMYIDPFLKRDMKYINDIYVVDESNFVKKMNILLKNISGKQNGKNLNNKDNVIRKKNLITRVKIYLKKIFIFILNLFRLYEDYSWSNRCKKIINKKFKNNEFDICLTSFSPISSHLSGMYLKKYKNIKWIADFRDPMDNIIISNKILLYFRRMIQKKVIKNADIVTCVSFGLKEHLDYSTKNMYTNKFRVIHNGFDEEDLYLLNHINNTRNERKIKFVYSGSLYMGKRDLSPLFNQLNSLIKEGYLKKQDIVINYVGKDGNVLKKQCGDLEECIFDYGSVDRKRSIEIQKDSDIIVVSTWNSEKTVDKGVIPIKFYEAIMLKKPILLLVSGSNAKCELADMILECNCGNVYSESLGDLYNISKLIKLVMDEKNKKLDSKTIEKYSWKNLIELFIKEF